MGNLFNGAVERNYALILDDDEAACGLMARMAAAAGFDVQIAMDRPQFIEKYMYCAPTIVVLDLFLGNEDVLPVFDFLKHQLYRGPVILVTGYNLRELAEITTQARGAGLMVVGAIQKNRNFQQLQQLLGAHYIGARSITAAAANTI